MNIELRQLRYFVTVAEELHFGGPRAAAHDPAAAVAGDRRAGRAAGRPLFLRNRRGVALDAGRHARCCRKRGACWRSRWPCPNWCARGRRRGGRLALAFVTSADYSVLPPFLRAYRAAYPHVHLTLQEATSDVQAEELLHNRIDAGLLIPPLPDKAQAGTRLHEGAGRAADPVPPAGLPALKKKGGCACRTLPALPLIIFPREISPALYDAILSCFRAAGITPVIGQQAIQMQTIVSLVSAGMGLALVPQSVSNLMRPGVEYRALADPTPLVEPASPGAATMPRRCCRAFWNYLGKN
jgi:DNA-binding transcriptional LysR family regulator